MPFNGHYHPFSGLFGFGIQIVYECGFIAVSFPSLNYPLTEIMETVTVSAGVHIFNRSQSKATDNYYIYIDISQDQDFTNLLRELRFNSGFTDRCTQLGITNFRYRVVSPFVIVRPGFFRMSGFAPLSEWFRTIYIRYNNVT